MGIITRTCTCTGTDGTSANTQAATGELTFTKRSGDWKFASNKIKSDNGTFGASTADIAGLSVPVHDRFFECKITCTDVANAIIRNDYFGCFFGAGFEVGYYVLPQAGVITLYTTADPSGVNYSFTPTVNVEFTIRVDILSSTVVLKVNGSTVLTRTSTETWPTTSLEWDVEQNDTLWLADDFTAGYDDPPAAAGINLDSKTSTSATFTDDGTDVAIASKQLEISSDGVSYSNVAGQTSSPYTATGLSAGYAKYFRLAQTKVAGGLLYSNVIFVRPGKFLHAGTASAFAYPMVASAAVGTGASQAFGSWLTPHHRAVMETPQISRVDASQMVVAFRAYCPGGIAGVAFSINGGAEELVTQPISGSYHEFITTSPADMASGVYSAGTYTAIIKATDFVVSDLYEVRARIVPQANATSRTAQGRLVQCSITVGTDTALFTATGSHQLSHGTLVKFAATYGATYPTASSGEFGPQTVCFARVISPTTFKLCRTLADALAGTNLMTFSSNGTGTFYVGGGNDLSEMALTVSVWRDADQPTRNFARVDTSGAGGGIIYNSSVQSDMVLTYSRHRDAVAAVVSAGASNAVIFVDDGTITQDNQGNAFTTVNAVWTWVVPSEDNVGGRLILDTGFDGARSGLRAAYMDARLANADFAVPKTEFISFWFDNPYVSGAYASGTGSAYLVSSTGYGNQKLFITNGSFSQVKRTTDLCPGATVRNNTVDVCAEHSFSAVKVAEGNIVSRLVASGGTHPDVFQQGDQGPAENTILTGNFVATNCDTQFIDTPGGPQVGFRNLAIDNNAILCGGTSSPLLQISDCAIDGLMFLHNTSNQGISFRTGDNASDGLLSRDWHIYGNNVPYFKTAVAPHTGHATTESYLTSVTSADFNWCVQGNAGWNIGNIAGSGSANDPVMSVGGVPSSSSPLIGGVSSLFLSTDAAGHTRGTSSTAIGAYAYQAEYEQAASPVVAGTALTFRNRARWRVNL